LEGEIKRTFVSDKRKPPRYELGIDVGAIHTKILLLREGKDVVGMKVLPTTMEPDKLVEGMLSSLLKEHSLTKNQIVHIVATGQGRKAIKFADLARTEITAFARGAYFLYPKAEVAVDVGGQGIRVMKMGEMGIISDFRTNVKCSSCTGCFLDTMAMAMNVDIDKIGELSLDSLNPESISTVCTVFAESEVVSLVAKGKKKEDILAGLNAMVAKKVGVLINATRSRGPVFLGGGVGLNVDVIKRLKERLERDIFVPKHPQFVGALGAALLAPKSMDHEDEDYEEDEDEEVGEKKSFFKRLRSKGGSR
jgi:predicted CoA-substrate-specific enzyme activase